MAHRRVDSPTTTDADVMRAVDVREPTLGVHGRLDRVQRLPNGALRVVEHKATPLKRAATVSEANRLQLTLQTMALESAGNAVEGAEVYFTTHRRRIPVEITGKDREHAREAVAATRAVVEAPTAPAPLDRDPRCGRCSHAAVCLPDERHEEEVTRRIMVPDSGADTLHLTLQGSRASLNKGRVKVVQGDESLASMPLERVAAVVVHGNVDLSSALIRELAWRGLPCIWCSGTGRVVGWLNGVRPPNGGARFRQFEASAAGRLDLAKEMVAAKIGNQATILRRFGGPLESVTEMRDRAREVRSASTITELFGIEGHAAATYFRNFSQLLSERARAEFGDSFPGRVGRGATDSVNVALNYGYGMLLGEVIRGVIACGLDPHAGVLHSPGRNKPALALDLMEEFRAVVVDSAVLTAFNNGELSARSFTHVLGGARLTQEGRKKIIAAVERRMATEFTHPVFGYRLTWRRALEVQARMFLGVIDGTQVRYKGVKVR